MPRGKVVSTTREELHRVFGEAFGQIAAIFTTQDIKGTEMVMPTDAMSKILDEAVAQFPETDIEL